MSSKQISKTMALYPVGKQLLGAYFTGIHVRLASVYLLLICSPLKTAILEMMCTIRANIVAEYQHYCCEIKRHIRMGAVWGKWRGSVESCGYREVASSGNCITEVWE